MKAGPLGLYRSPDPFPSRSFVQLRYSNTGYLAADTSFTFAYGPEGGTLCLNSIYAPQAGGHQPYGRDTLATLYYKYKVHKVDLTFEVSNSSGQNCMFTIMFLNPSSTHTLAGYNIDVIKEKPFSFSKMLAHAQNAFINKSVDIKTICAISTEEFESNTKDYAALIGSSPTNACYCRLAVASDALTAGMMITITMIQHVEFFERVPLAQS